MIMGSIRDKFAMSIQSDPYSVHVITCKESTPVPRGDSFGDDIDTVRSILFLQKARAPQAQRVELPFPAHGLVPTRGPDRTRVCKPGNGSTG